MSSNRFRVLLVSVLAVFAVSAVASASASAECLRVAPGETGNRDSTCATNVGASQNLWINGTVEKEFSPGVECAKTAEAGVGKYTSNSCATEGAPKNFIKVLSPPAGEKYEFLKGGASIAGKKFKGTQIGNSILNGSGVGITCTSGSSTGTFAVNTSWVENVNVTFKGCTEGTCKVKSVKPAGAAEEIKTEPIKGVIGEQTGAGAGGEEVAIDLEAENATHTFVELEGEPSPCLPLVKIKNAIIGEVASPVDVEAKKGELKFKENAGGTAQLLQNIEEEGSGGIADGPEHLEGFGTASRLTNTTEIELTTGEAFEVEDGAVEGSD